MKGKIRLTRKQRQLRFAVIMLVFTTVVFRNLPMLSKTKTSFMDNYEEIVVTIKHGDRAWNIQSELTPNEDVRELLYYVSLVNEKSVGNLIPGEQITFLKEIDGK